MPLFKQIAQIAKYIPISNTITNAQLPQQNTAEAEFIIPVLGQDLFEAMQTEANSIPGSPSALLQKVWAALAFFVYYKNAPYLYTRITESGFKHVTNENVQGAYKHQYYDVQNHMLADGYLALEQLFVFLLENKDDYPLWTGSEAYTRLNKNLIKTGTQFTRLYNIYQPNRTFNALQPIMQEVEDMYIVPSIGRAFFEYLRDAPTPTDAEKEVIDLLRKSIANFTIARAVTKLSITIMPEGVTVMQMAGIDSPVTGSANAPQPDKRMVQQDAERDGNAYLLRAVEYLNAYASVSVFPLFFASALYVNPATEKVDINLDKKVFVL